VAADAQKGGTVKIIWISILLLFASPCVAFKVFVETEPSTYIREVFSLHAGAQISPDRVDAYGTYMWGSGSRPDDNFVSGGSADFDHQCWGIGLRRSEDTSIDGGFQSFNLRYAETEWSASCGIPIRDHSLAFIWSQGRRVYAVGTHYIALSFDLGLQRIQRTREGDEDKLVIGAVVGLTLSLGVYLP
jgi:hypothetical protein